MKIESVEERKKDLSELNHVKDDFMDSTGFFVCLLFFWQIDLAKHHVAKMHFRTDLKLL